MEEGGGPVEQIQEAVLVSEFGQHTVLESSGFVGTQVGHVNEGEHSANDDGLHY